VMLVAAAGVPTVVVAMTAPRERGGLQVVVKPPRWSAPAAR
jgi:hypothetical protein